MKLKICVSIVMLLSLKGINSAHVELQNPELKGILEAQSPQEKILFLKGKKAYLESIQRKRGKFRDRIFIEIISKIEKIQDFLEGDFYYFFNVDQSVRLNDLLLQFFSKVESIETNISIKGFFGRSSSYKGAIVDDIKELNRVYRSIWDLFQLVEKERKVIALRRQQEYEHDLLLLNAKVTMFEEQILNIIDRNLTVRPFPTYDFNLDGFKVSGALVHSLVRTQSLLMREKAIAQGREIDLDDLSAKTLLLRINKIVDYIRNNFDLKTNEDGTYYYIHNNNEDFQEKYQHHLQQYRLKEAAEAAAKARIGYRKPIEELSYEEYY
jgi:hypothetical protein